MGASTQDRAFVVHLHLDCEGAGTSTCPGRTVTAGLSASPVILADDVPGYAGTAVPGPLRPRVGHRQGCGLPAGHRMPAWRRGTTSCRAEAAGFILYNTAVTDVETDNHWIPAVHLNINEGAQMLAFLGSHSGVTATWTTGVSTPRRGTSWRRSRRGDPSVSSWKPDVTSVGVQVLAGMTPRNRLRGPSSWGRPDRPSSPSPERPCPARIRRGHPPWSMKVT